MGGFLVLWILKSLFIDHYLKQKIQRVLDENLVCKEDLPSHTLMYKNLWLEAEAELCTLSYRSRFHRAQREIYKSKASGIARDIIMDSSGRLVSDQNRPF